MAENEEYDSDNSDSTVLLADFLDNPKKIDVKRRRFSNLHDRDNQTYEFDGENTAPCDVSVNRRTGNSPDKKRNNVDKNWHIAKYFACINKNNDTNIKNNDAKLIQNLDFNGKQVRSDIQIKQDNIPKENIDSDEIICLDSEEETQIDDNSQDQDIKSVEISAGTERINNQNLVHKPAPLTTRRATTEIFERNKTPQTVENKYPKVRVLKPYAINARRATTHFEENNFNSNVIGKTTSIPKSTYKENENEIESYGYRSTPRLSVSRSADVNTYTNTDCNNIGVRTTAVHNNTRTSTLAPSIQPLKTYINQNNGLINKGPRQKTNVFLNVNTHKRCGSNNETQTEPKRIKVDAKCIEPAEFNKNSPSSDLKITAQKESGRLESSQPYMDVRNEMDVMSGEHKAIHDGVGNETSNGQNASESKNTIGAVNEKRAPVNTIDVKTESTVAKTIPNKAAQLSALTGLLHKVKASKMSVNLTPHKNKAANYRIERSDGSAVDDNSTPIAKTFNVCQNRGTSEAGIIQETYESCDKKETTKIQDVINKLQNKQRPNKVQDDPETSNPSDVVHDKHEVSKLQSGCKINQTHEKHETNATLVKTVPNQARYEQKTGEILDKGKSSETLEINKVQDGHEICKTQTIDNPEIRKKQTETETSNILNKKEPSQVLDMTIVCQTNEKQETDKVYDQLETNNLQDDQISNVTLDKQETIEAGNVQVEVTVRKNNIIEIHHRQEAQDVSNVYKSTGSTNVQETVKKNEATSKTSRDADDENVFLLKIHVHFFTEVKEYLKDIFPESAMELENIIETLIIDARNGQVQKDVKYCCPKCSRVSDYSSRILNNMENEENKTNADGSQTCGFCNGIRKLHNSYLKKYLANKYSVDEKKGDVKIGKGHTKSAGRIRNSSVGEIVIGNSQTINISQLGICSTIDNNINKPANNITTPSVVSGTDTVKVSDQDTPVTKDNLDNFDEKASSKTDLGLKRKSDITYKEATDTKLIKTNTEETTRQSVENLLGVSRTSNPRNETLTNERPHKIQISSVQYITSPKTARLNSSLQSDTEVNRVANFEPSSDVMMTSAKSSDESTKEFHTNTTHLNTHDACLNPKTNSDNIITAEAEELNKRDKHFSEDCKQTMDVTSNENMNKERQRDVHQDEKEKTNYSTSTGSILDTNETNVNQVRNTEENYQGKGDVLKPLVDCFAKIKNSLKEKDDTPMKAQEGNKTPPESTSKIRPKIRGNRSNSLDNLQSRDEKKIVMKYLCPICRSIYVYSSKLLRHMQEKHNPNLTTLPLNCEILQCPFCRALLSNNKYNTHVKANHPEKFNEIVGGVENSNNNHKRKNEKHRSMKNKTFLSRGNTESTKSSESHLSSNKNLTTDDATRQHKNQRRSEYKYQHLIRRIKTADVNNDKQNEIPCDKNEELRQDKSDTQHTSIENEGDSPAAASTGEITSNINNTLPHVNHTEWCCEESDKSAERPTAIHNEEDRTPADCNGLTLDTIEESHVRLLHKGDMDDTNETCHFEHNYSKIYETEPGQSKARKESIKNQIVDEENSSRRVSNNESNESETGKSHGIDNDISITSANENLTATCTVENGKQGNNELSTRYINNGKQSTGNTATGSTQICCSNINKEQETDSEDDCIKASDYTVKKRIERNTKLFGDENEASVSSKIKGSSELFACQKEYQTPKDRNKKTERRKRNRKADVVKRRRKVTVEQCTESSESRDTSDSDWIISNDETSDSSDSCDEFCTIKKQQVVRKLFSSKKKLSLLNGTTEESSSESGENNDDEEDEEEETIKSCTYTVKKKNERLSELFGDDAELSVSNEISEEDDRQPRSDKNGHRCDRQCVEIQEGNNESVPSNNEQKVLSNDETLKISEQTIKKKNARISKYFGDDNEALVQDSNQQMEQSDMNNAGCRVLTPDDGRTKDVNDRLEDTQCRVDRPEMRDHRINNENCVNEIYLQETSSRNIQTHMNAVKNAESKSRDDDRVEINMIDRLLKEFAYDDNQNGACADKENDSEDYRKAEISGECQGTSQTAKVQNCLDHIQITNVTSVGGKTNVFICLECNYGTDVYDDAIRHCQNHYNLIEDQVTYCSICQINYATICFERHQSTHDKYLGNIKIKFSYHWLFTNWQVVFDKNNISLSEAEDTQVKSIYKTFCVKMTVKEDGPWQSAVYICIKCNTCVPSSDVEKHVQQKCTFGNYPCSKCDRVFLTYELLKHHEIYHTEHASEIFKTIVFNDQNDESFNSKLRQVKAQSREKPRTADIFKCLCGLCFITLKKFKLHFAYCDTELVEGSRCRRCPGTWLFSTTELEEHLLLHHSSLNYEFRVQKVTFQLEYIIDNSERESPLGNSNSTDNATQMTSNDEDLNIKTDMLKVESFTQSAVEENRRENVNNNNEENIQSDQINESVPKTSDSITENTSYMGSNDIDLIIKRDMIKAESLIQTTDKENRHENNDKSKEEHINRVIIDESVPGTSDSTTDKVAQKTLNDEDMNIKRNMEQLKLLTNGENGRENTGNVEKEDINRGLINVTVREINYEDLIIKRDMLKDETQNTNEKNSQEILYTDEFDTEASGEVTVVEKSINPINIEDSQEVNEAHGGPITINGSQEMTLNDEDLNIKRNMEQLKQLTNRENGREHTYNVEKEDVIRGLINVTVPDINYEDLIIKRDMLKGETLTQKTNEENSQDILDTDEKEDISREGNPPEISAIDVSKNPLDTEASGEVTVVEQSINPINIEDSQEVNEAHGGPITIDGSQEMEVEESTHLITIEDSDDEDVEFISGSFPDTAKIFPLSYYFKR